MEQIDNLINTAIEEIEQQERLNKLREWNVDEKDTSIA